MAGLARSGLSAPGTEAELLAELVDHRLGRAARFERVCEVEADAERVALRAVEVHGTEIDAEQLPGRTFRRERRAPLEPVGESLLDLRSHGDRGYRPIDLLVHIVGRTEAGLLAQLPVASQLEDRSGGLPGDRGYHRSGSSRRAVSPRVKSAMRTSGVVRRIAELADRRQRLPRDLQLAMRFSRVRRRPVCARADLGQRAEVRKLVDLGIGVQREVAERASRARDAEMGKSKLIAALPAVRLSEFGVMTPAAPRSVSRFTVLAPTRNVVPALPAGSLNNVPFAVAVMSPEVVVWRARSSWN